MCHAGRFRRVPTKLWIAKELEIRPEALEGLAIEDRGAPVTQVCGAATPENETAPGGEPRAADQRDAGPMSANIVKDTDRPLATTAETSPSVGLCRLIGVLTLKSETLVRSRIFQDQVAEQAATNDDRCDCFRCAPGLIAFTPS